MPRVPDQHHRPWTDQDSLLAQRLAAGWPLDRIAQDLQRTPRAIQERIRAKGWGLREASPPRHTSARPTRREAPPPRRVTETYPDDYYLGMAADRESECPHPRHCPETLERRSWWMAGFWDGQAETAI